MLFKNLKNVDTSLKQAEHKVNSAITQSKMHKNSVVFKQKVDEMNRQVEMIRQQRVDAYNQKVKIEHERKIAKAKADEISIAAAKAKQAV